MPARTSAQRRFHTKNTRIVRGDLTTDAPLQGGRGRVHRHCPYQSPSYFSTQSHTNKITIYMQSTQTTSTVPYVIHPNETNRLRAICPNETNHPRLIHPNEAVGAVPVCPPERPRSGVSIRKWIIQLHTSGAEMHRALPPPFFKTSCVCKLASR